MRSACVTSTLRTYYTWKIFNSRDSSYNMMVMCLWSWGEVDSGILVSCLPVMLKFFQHFWPKVYKVLSYRSGSRAKIGDNSRSAGTYKGRFHSRIRQKLRPSAAGSDALSKCNSAYQHEVPQHREYLTLGEVDTATMKDSETDGRALRPTAGQATKRDDLEIGSIILQH